MTEISVGGYIPMTTIDYPDHLSAVVFTQGCPLACSYCHNDHLRPPKVNQPKYSWPNIRRHLAKRVNLLDAVVFSGGEPTLQKNLKSAILECKDMGYKIGLHTSGVYPKRLADIIELVDWVGLDIKAPFEDYKSITGIKSSGQKAKKCLELLLEHGIDTECRTTYHPALLSHEQLLTIKDQLTNLGVSKYSLQNFRKEGCINKTLCSKYPFTPIDNKIIEIISADFEAFNYDA